MSSEVRLSITTIQCSSADKTGLGARFFSINGPFGGRWQSANFRADIRSVYRPFVEGWKRHGSPIIRSDRALEIAFFSSVRVK